MLETLALLDGGSIECVIIGTVLSAPDLNTGMDRWYYSGWKSEMWAKWDEDYASVGTVFSALDLDNCIYWEKDLD